MLSYTVTGSLDLPPLLFLHGFLGEKEDWQEVISHLKNHYCCWAFDLPGHGASPLEEHFLESILTSCYALKLVPCSLIGYSMGGRMALLLKEYFPKCFNKLILLGAHPGLQEEQEKRLRWYHDLNWSLFLEREPLSSFLNAWYAQPLFDSLKKRPDLKMQILEKRKKQDPQSMAAVLRNFSLSKQPSLTKFHPGTLFLHGNEDPLFSHLYQEQLPKDVPVESIIGGHLLHLENPAAVAAKIKDFL